MAEVVLRAPTATQEADAREAEEMMEGWDQVGPWFSRGSFWLGVLVASVIVVVFVVESIAAGVGV